MEVDLTVFGMGGGDRVETLHLIALFLVRSSLSGCIKLSNRRPSDHLSRLAILSFTVCLRPIAVGVVLRVLEN